MTDSEWELIQTRAGRAGLTTTAFLRRRALDPVPDEAGAVTVPLELLRRVAIETRLLTTLERWRVEAAGGDEDWHHAMQAAEREIDAVLP